MFAWATCKEIGDPKRNDTRSFYQEIDRNGYLADLADAQTFLQEAEPEQAWSKLDTFQEKVKAIPDN